MVGQSGRRTHQIYLTETIHFQPLPKGIDRSKIARLHVDNGFSSAQIAEQLGCSKTLVITTLRRLGLLHPKRGSQTKERNYRKAVPPYGYRVVDGKLLTRPSELRVCRVIVDLIKRQGYTRRRAAEIPEEEGVKGRRGIAKWHNYTVSRIYDRWKDKL